MQDMKSKRIALYARVSTKNKDQDPETQLMPLREYAKYRSCTITEEYVDIGVSGSKERRPALDRLMNDAKKRKFDAVVVWKFDRFARSVKHLLIALAEFQALGVDFVSLSESLDTSTPMGKAMFTILGAIAELERDLIRERVMAGVSRARKQGKHLGRPRVVVDREKVRKCAAQGQSVKSIARDFGIGRATVDRILGKVPKTLSAGAVSTR